MADQRYLIALGSNMRHSRHGRPRAVLNAALTSIEDAGLRIEAASPWLTTSPLGPSRRRYANGAAVVASQLDPDAMLAVLHEIEHAFGRRRRGARWSARVIDLDLVLWSGGCWSSPRLTIPHPAFRRRAFVLAPAASVARAWRDPVTGLTVQQLQARLTRPRPLPR